MFGNKEEKTTLSQKTEQGCLISFVGFISAIVILNFIIDKNPYVFFFLLVPISLVFMYKNYQKENTTLLEHEKNEAKEKEFGTLIENLNLPLFSSFLDSKELRDNLLKESEIDLLEFLAGVIVKNKVKDFEEGLEFELINMRGGAFLKQRLLEEYDIDISVIDNEISRIEENLPITVSDLLGEVHSYGYQSKTEKRYNTENKRNNLNSYYETQNQEMNEILGFGCLNINKFNFEQYVKRIDNLKYYPNYSIEVPFGLNEFENKYNALDETAFEFFNKQILKNSIYPCFVTKDFELSYKNESKTIVVDYCLPNIEDIPVVKQINKQLNEVAFKEKEINALYENVLYQITLRTIFELFYNDEINALDSVVFNGWLDYTDKGDGNQKTSCILSMQAKKDEFIEIKLENVEPKVCFKKFKGISCNNLSTITPVKPILFVNREDKRFIESYEVMAKLSEGDNLAMMDWRDFENLIQEIFEKEFSQNGGEVKVTQSSRDGGVDAIAFDPDPIRGGKIVIQAKRYTNVVGVSAVRDLYGTVMNEGATKGILVTTSHFGADSYDFAKDKPLTLLEGSNLLHLMEKHGHKARIDIKEARLLKDS